MRGRCAAAGFVQRCTALLTGLLHDELPLSSFLRVGPTIITHQHEHFYFYCIVLGKSYNRQSISQPIQVTLIHNISLFIYVNSLYQFSNLNNITNDASNICFIFIITEKVTAHDFLDAYVTGSPMSEFPPIKYVTIQYHI